MQPMQATSRRIRSRRVAALTTVTLLTLAVSTSAGTGHLSAGSTTAGSIALARSTALGPCMISGAMGVQMGEGIPTQPGYARSTGTVRALTLMVDFSDAPGPGSALDRLAEFFPQTQNWFRTSSYGRLDYRPETPIHHWLRMPKPFKAYGIERGAPFDPGYRDLVQDIVATADPEVDFHSYDLLNVLVTPNAGPSALDTVLSVTFAGNTEAPIADGVPVSNASFVYSRQDDGSGSYAETGYRVLPHENGHTFGLPDLYTQEGGGAVGHWDIMSEDWGPTTTSSAGTSGNWAGSTSRRSDAPRRPGRRSTPSPRCPVPAARNWSSYPPAPRRGTPSNCAPAAATTPPSAAPASSSTRSTRAWTPETAPSPSTTPSATAAAAPAAPTSTRNSPTPPSPPASPSRTPRPASRSRSRRWIRRATTGCPSHAADRPLPRRSRSPTC